MPEVSRLRIEMAMSSPVRPDGPPIHFDWKEAKMTAMIKTTLKVGEREDARQVPVSGALLAIWRC